MTRRKTDHQAGGKRGSTAGQMPARDEILAFVADHPDRASKRDIAKAFSLKGAARVELKQMLREMENEGLLEKRRKRLQQPGALPSVLVIDIFSRDAGGGLLARPAEWDDVEAPAPLIAVRAQRKPGGPAPGVGDRALVRIQPSDDKAGPPYTAMIMKVLDRRRESVLGVFRKADDGSLRIEPVERRQPELLIDPELAGGAKPGDLVEVEQIGRQKYGLPRGKVRTVVGSLVTEKAVSLIAIHAHGIPNVFPAEVLEAAQAAKSATMKNREDWRDLPLVTIDPADAKDHDDAVHAAPDTDEKNPGGHVVTVAIADVAAYVTSGSSLDREALKRGNSVYFPDRVVPMLPERISNDLCSLRQLEDRPALAVRMVFDAQGRKLRHDFHRVMIRSAAKLAYVQAQAAIDGATDETTAPLLEPVLRPLWAAYEALSRGRKVREPLELDLPERKILLKSDGTVDRVVVPDRLDAHKLIEEFMIQANVAAAETLERKQQALIYRVHDTPSLAKQESLREFLRTIGLSLARGAQLRPGQFNQILTQVDDTEHEAMVNEVVLRSQSQAVYSPANLGHFGLNLRSYAHFTSPIRRYADLIVHRALIASLGLGAGGITADEEARLEDTAALISASERRAMAAERDTVDRLVAAHLAERVGETFEGRVAGVTKAGLFVQLPHYGADGFVPISTLGNEYYHYDESAHAVFGDRTGQGYRLGDAVEVRLANVAPMAGSMQFEMMTDPQPLPGMTRSFHKAKAGSRRGARTIQKSTRGRSRKPK